MNCGNKFVPQIELVTLEELVLLAAETAHDMTDKEFRLLLADTIGMARHQCAKTDVPIVAKMNYLMGRIGMLVVARKMQELNPEFPKPLPMPDKPA